MPVPVYISRSAVQARVSHILAKLSLRTRVELVKALAERR
jgi:DNA-binding NarL/FixJ family response regulator